MTAKYPLASTTWDEAEYAAMNRVIESGMFTMGPHVRAFEESFARWQGSTYAVMVNSGSSANLLMVAALFYTQSKQLRLAPGDEAIVPAVSWATTYYPLAQYGLKQKFVDIDVTTLNMDLDALEAAITPRTRVIFAVNLLGNPNNYDRIKAIIGDRPIVLLEDNCESMGASFGGRKTGSHGVMGSFSSFFSHHISTMEGGLIATDDEELYHILLSLRAHGWTRNLPKHNKVTGTKSDDPFKESFNFVLPGYNVRPLELSGAIGVEQVKKLDGFIAARRANGARFTERMANHKDLMIQHETGQSSWFGFSVVIKPGSDLTRERLLRRLEETGFEARPIVCGNFARNPVITHIDADVSADLKNATYIDENGLFVGNHHYDIGEAIDILARI